MSFDGDISYWDDCYANRAPVLNPKSRSAKRLWCIFGWASEVSDYATYEKRGALITKVARVTVGGSRTENREAPHLEEPHHIGR